MKQRTRRSPARWLAPLALIAVVVAFYAIVSGSDNGGGGSSTSGVGTTQSTTGHSAKAGKTGTAVAKTKGSRKVYVVKIGDTLGSIADRTGVSLARLQELNPDVDSNLMTAGQKIRLR